MEPFYLVWIHVEASGRSFQFNFPARMVRVRGCGQGKGSEWKRTGKLNAKRPRVCRFPGLMCTLGLRGEEAGRDLQLKQMSLENLLSETRSGLFLWAVLTSCIEGEELRG